MLVVKIQVIVTFLSLIVSYFLIRALSGARDVTHTVVAARSDTTSCFSLVGRFPAMKMVEELHRILMLFSL